MQVPLLRSHTNIGTALPWAVSSTCQWMRTLQFWLPTIVFSGFSIGLDVGHQLQASFSGTLLKWYWGVWLQYVGLTCKTIQVGSCILCVKHLYHDDDNKYFFDLSCLRCRECGGIGRKSRFRGWPQWSDLLTTDKRENLCMLYSLQSIISDFAVSWHYMTWLHGFQWTLRLLLIEVYVYCFHKWYMGRVCSKGARLAYRIMWKSIPPPF